MASAQNRKPRLRFPGQNVGLGSLSSVRFTRKPKQEDDKNTGKKTDHCLPFKVYEANEVLLGLSLSILPVLSFRLCFLVIVLSVKPA